MRCNGALLHRHPSRSIAGQASLKCPARVPYRVSIQTGISGNNGIPFEAVCAGSHASVDRSKDSLVGDRAVESRKYREGIER